MPSSCLPVRMEDLLGRDSLDCRSGPEVFDAFRNRRVLITGAAGSIGSELARQLVDASPSKLILLDQDESGLFEVGSQIRESSRASIAEVVADVRNRARSERIFREHDPQVVFHAAAYKHVPMMERNPAEAITTNVLGTRNMVGLAVRNRVQDFLLISTDKAVNPTSIMGASKRVAEMIVQKASRESEGGHYCCVRFGNVLGSRASVVPIFQQRIARRLPVRVTHPEMRRYFMTLAEAVHLVIQAGAMKRSGEVLALDMGAPIKIVDLARDLIRLNGLIPGEDIPIEFSGPRPGEKLFEELVMDAEHLQSTEHPLVFVACAEPPRRHGLEEAIDGLEKAALQDDAHAIQRIFRFLSIGFRSARLDDLSQTR